ncbi:MAG TPA: glycosyltransferase [Ktedonobacterales bacterium]|jgi:chlorobactene glucosyltransferase
MGRINSWRALERVALWGSTAAFGAFYLTLLRRAAWSGPALGTEANEAPEADGPLVSIIVPARNEAANIEACVASLLRQDYPHVEVIVADDGSTDATPDLLAALGRAHPAGARLRTIRVAALPPGWAGKPHALHVGAAAARGAWLLFTDADTLHAPGALSAALAQAQALHADLYSLMTAQILPDFWNRVLMPIAFMGISAQYPIRQVNDPRKPLAIANGQYMLIRRAAYDAVGGYASPRLSASIVDDRDLAAEVKRAGFRLVLADGRAQVRTRMYRDLAGHWHGWGKNAVAGSRGGPLAFVGMSLGLLGLSVLPPVLLLAGAALRRRAWVAAGAAQTAATVLYRRQVDGALAVPWPYDWTQPLGGAVFSAILARAAWRKLAGKGVEWSGRTYPA